MSEELSQKMISQTADSVAKLCELNSRMDERLKIIQEQHDAHDHKLDGIVRDHNDGMQKVAILEAAITGINHAVEEETRSLTDLDRRVTVVEMDTERRVSAVEVETDRSENRWNQISTFVIQLVWVLLAAWLLVKLNLQAPAIP